jgi:hypothetical protein
MYGWPATEMTTTPSGGFHMVYEGWADASHPAHIMALGENGIGKDIDSPNYTLIPGCTFDDGTSYVGNDAEAVKCPRMDLRHDQESEDQEPHHGRGRGRDRA